MSAVGLSVVGTWGSPAAAELAPQPCQSQTINNFDVFPSQDWPNNCYLSRNNRQYDNKAAWVVGVQRILRATASGSCPAAYPGPANDGLFGSQTDSGVRGYRACSGALANTPAGADAVVDDDMWGHFREYKLRGIGPLDTSTGRDGYVYSVQGSSGNQAFWQLADNASDNPFVKAHWYSRTPTNSYWEFFDHTNPGS